MVLKSAHSSSSGDVEVFRQNQVAREIDRAKMTAMEIERYEQKVVKEYHAMDLYRKKNKSWKQISFNDLTLEENLNYIKYSLKSSHEAFSMFDITKDRFANHPELASSIVQKLATRSDIHAKNFEEKLFSRPEYKAMLK